MFFVEKKIQNSNRDLWAMYVEHRSKAKADGITVFGKRLATSVKKMIICLKSSIYSQKTYLVLHLWHQTLKLDCLSSVLATQS